MEAQDRVIVLLETEVCLVVVEVVVGALFHHAEAMAAFVLFGLEILAHSHQHKQVICDGTVH